MLWILWLVLVAGHETTVHLIANTVVALCSDPAQLAFARAKNAWEQVVEEADLARTALGRHTGPPCAVVRKQAAEGVGLSSLLTATDLRVTTDPPGPSTSSLSMIVTRPGRQNKTVSSAGAVAML
ncbi:hypothetical protein [Nonomuraea angiospora]